LTALKLYRRLPPENVLVAPPVSTREELFRAFAELFRARGLVETAAQVVAGLEEREAILSTGIGRGVAVPHAQLADIGALVVAASTHPDGLAYPSLDGRPVRLAFCLLADADAAADHLAGLARIARLARRDNAVERLVHAQTGDDFIARLTELEGEA